MNESEDLLAARQPFVLRHQVGDVAADEIAE